MAVFTRIGHKRISRLFADPDCYYKGELLQVWTVLEDFSTPTKRFVTDLVADHGHDEILDLVRAAAKGPGKQPLKPFPTVTAFPKINK
jgi:hypothetical protein